MSGPRYVFEALPLAIVLAAGTLGYVCDRLAVAGIRADRARATLLVLLALCFTYGTASTLHNELPYYRNLHSVDVRMFDVVRRRVQQPAIVFVPVPPSGRYTNKFVAAVARNDPALEGPILYARDLGERNRELIAALPGRHLYRWDDAAFSLEPLGSDGLPARLPRGRP